MLVSCVRAQSPSASNIYSENATPSNSVGYGMMNMGRYGTAAVMADINRDGHPDVVIANGNDMSPQTIAVYLNTGTNQPLPPYPDWESAVSGYFGGLAVGDINQDGWLDVVASSYMGREREQADGGVSIFLNQRGRLEEHPSQFIGGLMVGGVALGDLDADGDLDLAIAPAMKGSQRQLTALPKPITPTTTRVHFNTGGRFSEEAGWHTPVATPTFQVRVADINLDGWLDLLVAGEVIYAYLGQPLRDSGGLEQAHAALERTPSWQSPEFSWPFSYGLDYGILSASSGVQHILYSSSCPGTCSDSLFAAAAYGSEKLDWSYTEAPQASKVFAADINLDGSLDLVTTDWGAPTSNVLAPYEGGPVRIFTSDAEGLSDAPSYTSTTLSIGQEIAGSALPAGCVSKQSHTASGASDGIAAVTLPDRRVLSVDAVTVDGTALAAWQYNWTPLDSWVTFSPPLREGQTATVSYTTPARFDLIVSTWDPALQDLVFPSYITCP